MRGQNVLKSRREGALERLKNSVFFEKNGRTEEAWQKRKDQEIENLEIALGIRTPRKR
jgi:hypothetical protein